MMVDRNSVYKVIHLTPKVFPDYGPDKCVYCGEELPPLRRKYCCDSHGNNYRMDTRTEERIYWSGFRMRIIRRDDYTCKGCGIRHFHEEGLTVHHIIPISKGGEPFDKDNCETLCEKCHKKKHWKRMSEPTSDSKQTFLSAEGFSADTGGSPASSNVKFTRRGIRFK